METFTLKNDQCRDVRFTGERIAHTCTSPDQSSNYYSGSVGRYSTWNLYRTKAGKYVGEKIGYTQWQDERDSHDVAILEDHAAVRDFFGMNNLAKDVYEEAGIECLEEIE